jgi:hypothetical protein
MLEDMAMIGWVTVLFLFPLFLEVSMTLSGRLGDFWEDNISRGR